MRWGVYKDENKGSLILWMKTTGAKMTKQINLLQ